MVISMQDSMYLLRVEEGEWVLEKSRKGKEKIKLLTPLEAGR